VEAEEDIHTYTYIHTPPVATYADISHNVYTHPIADVLDDEGVEAEEDIYTCTAYTHASCYNIYTRILYTPSPADVLDDEDVEAEEERLRRGDVQPIFKTLLADLQQEVCICICMGIYVCVRVYMHICVYICGLIYMYIYIYKST